MYKPRSHVPYQINRSSSAKLKAAVFCEPFVNRLYFLNAAAIPKELSKRKIIFTKFWQSLNIFISNHTLSPFYERKFLQCILYRRFHECAERGCRDRIHSWIQHSARNPIKWYSDLRVKKQYNFSQG